MPRPMTVAQHYNYILSYEHAIEALKERPGDNELQHQAVLSLARSGALDFAIAEYHRFGLNDITDHEDIMALNGRLSKENMKLPFNQREGIIPASTAQRWRSWQRCRQARSLSE